MTGWRMETGGALLDRERRVPFRFDGLELHGFAGDSLASALLAGGRMTLARSFKYHRPRGALSAGPEEPNALVTLHDGARSEPNSRATMVELYDGLVAHSQNRWPSLAFDLHALIGLAAPLLPAGFYYKTFMAGGQRGWHFAERHIRRAAGLGRASLEPDPDGYDSRHAFCDVLVVGAGPAGLQAARSAAAGGARVILADEQAVPGGALWEESCRLDGIAAGDWGQGRFQALAALSNVTLLPRTTVAGYYDGNLLAAVERVADHLPRPGPLQQRLRLWKIQAQQVVIAAGAIERTIVFPGNDRPGVMLAGAALRYAARQAVAVGRKAVLFTCHDGGHDTAFALHDLGVPVQTIVDCRPALAERLRAGAAARGIGQRPGQVVCAADGGAGGLGRVALAAWDGSRPTGRVETLPADALLVAGGWNPNLQLPAQAGGRPVWDPQRLTFLPGPARERWRVAGAAAGLTALQACLQSGAEAGAAAARDAGFDAVPAPLPAGAADLEPGPGVPLWEVPPRRGRAKAFVDLQNDVTAEDVRLASREGYRSVEHLKRYTTLGMAPDQGRTSNLNGLAILAAARDLPIGEVGTTSFRAPAAPVALGPIAGTATGAHLRPVRRTPMHDWHVAAGAEMLASGLWLRPRAYRRGGESLEEAYVREARHVREAVGMVDVSTLGKIDVQGPDAAEFLNRVYANGFLKLPVGKARYGVMLRDDGLVFDDGTTWRLSERHFLMTTTTANAGPVLAHLEFLLAIAWPELRVHVASVTDQWAAMAVAGPKSREVLQACVSGLDLDNAAFPAMAVGAASLDGMPVMVARLSFSGELAFEVYAPAHCGMPVWQAVMAAGAAAGIIAYGTEAMGTLRIEKGHVSAPELDGRVTMADLGLGRMASTKKPYIGRPLMDRPGLTDPKRRALVGLKALEGRALRSGAHLVAALAPPGRGTPEQHRLGPSLGHVTSTTYSPAQEAYVALALLEGGAGRLGETLTAADPLRWDSQRVEVVAPCFVDPEGRRMHG
ncbi:MAG: sarcosine oxidase subunit alpha family protein [Sneathiellaceae bacterium]